jgi:hypothetical protein
VAICSIGVGALKWLQFVGTQTRVETVGIAHVLNAENEKSDLVWHYTNATGLLGILKYGCLWASNVNFLNDVTENKRAKQLLHANIQKRLLDLNDYERIRQHLNEDGKTEVDYTQTEHHEHLVNVLLSGAWSTSADNVFIACFSAMEDSLSQWRAYAGVGGSYAIGFSREQLTKLTAYPTQDNMSKNFIRTHFVKLEYYNAKLHDDVFDSLGDALITQSFRQSNIEHWVQMLVDDTAPQFKDTSFEEEHEWRLICRGNLDYMGVKFRPGRSHLVPYIEVSLENISGVIKEIMVGPGPNKDLDVLALETMIKSQHQQFKVSASKTPFRNW